VVSQFLATGPWAQTRSESAPSKTNLHHPDAAFVPYQLAAVLVLLLSSRRV
jgi:hypothetical protein